MTNALIYSDPHRGLARKANFTPESVKRREQYCDSQLLGLLEAHTGPTMCLGDFFDKTSNPEAVIVEALPMAERTDLILAGNHDIPNQQGKESSLSLLAEVMQNKVLISDPQKGEGFTTTIGDTLFCLAPHAMTQETYDGMIDGLCLEAEKYEGRCQILCLHCNYAMGEELITEGTLNLSRDRAYQLLSYFHYILIGHVHNQSEDFEGRVKVVGSPFPTSFSDMEDKRVLLYDSDKLEFIPITTWSADDSLYYGQASDLYDLLLSSSKPVAYQYYDLLDDTQPGEAQKLTMDLFKKHGAFGVRLRRSEEKSLLGSVDISTSQFEKLPDTIGEELQRDRPHLVSLWNELRSEQA